MSTSISENKSQLSKSLLQKVKSAFYGNVGIVLLISILLLGAIWQNRLLVSDLNNASLPAKKDAAFLNFIIRDLTAQVFLLQSGKDTFAVNDTKLRIQQDLIKFDEVLYRLAQFNTEPEVLSKLRSTAEEVRQITAQTVDLQQRFLERQQLKQEALNQLLDLRESLNQSIAANVEETQWFQKFESLIEQLMYAALNVAEVKIKPLETEFQRGLEELNQIPVSRPLMLSYRDQLNVLGTGSQGLFSTLYDCVLLDVAAQSNQNINTAVLTRFSKLGQRLFTENADDIQEVVDKGAKVNLGFMMLAFSCLLILISRLTVVQNFLMKHLILRLIVARETVQHNANSDLNRRWQLLSDEEKLRDTDKDSSDEISELLQECQLLFERMQRRNQEIQVLSSIGRDLSAADTMDELMEGMNQRASEFPTADVVVLATWRHTSAEFDFPVTIKVNQNAHNQSIISQVKMLISDLGKRESHTHILNHKSLKAHLTNISFKDCNQIGSILYLPLKRHHGGFLGCFCLINYQQNSFSPGQIKSMETLARYIAIAMENTSTHNQLRRVQGKLHLMEKITRLHALHRDEANSLALTASEQVVLLDNLKNQLTKVLQANANQSEVQEIKSQLVEVRQSARELETQIRQLQSITQNQDEAPAGVALSKVLKTHLDLLRQQFSDIEFALNCRTELTIMAKPEALSQAIQDLLLNACLAIKQRQEKQLNFSPQVDVELFHDSEHLTLVVSDNGQGLVESATSKILEPDFEPQRYSAGPRISLAVANECIIELKGELQLLSESSKSNRTLVKFPIQRDE